jgi:hypothetical protein
VSFLSAAVLFDQARDPIAALPSAFVANESNNIVAGKIGEEDRLLARHHHRHVLTKSQI